MSLAPAQPARRRPRRCVATRQPADRALLIRFVVAPDGGLVADLAERLPGRGIWLSADRGAIERALAGRAFARAARQAVRVSPALVGDIEALLERRCVETLSLARRAGDLVGGFDRVSGWLREGRCGALIAARDAADGQRARLVALAPGCPVVSELDRASIGRALGRDETTYAVIARGPLAARLVRDDARLAGLRGRRPGGGEPRLEIEEEACEGTPAPGGRPSGGPGGAVPGDTERREDDDAS